jgi:hypothetical protein
MSAPATAALLLIGNELLSGKIVDQNGQLAISTLRRRGIDLVEVRIVADDEAAIGAAALLVAGSAGAQYPTKPVTMIIPFAAGGPTDTLGRNLGQAITKQFKQTILIENVGPRQRRSWRTSYPVVFVTSTFASVRSACADQAVALEHPLHGRERLEPHRAAPV